MKYFLEILLNWVKSYFSVWLSYWFDLCSLNGQPYLTQECSQGAFLSLPQLMAYYRCLKRKLWAMLFIEAHLICWFLMAHNSLIVNGSSITRPVTFGGHEADNGRVSIIFGFLTYYQPHICEKWTLVKTKVAFQIDFGISRSQ